MVYLLCAYDPSAAGHPEVKRAMDYYERRYVIQDEKTGTHLPSYNGMFWPEVFELLRKDNGWRNTFNETGSDLNRRLARTVTINYQTDDVWDKKI
jgi:hypothetical protein